MILKKLSILIISFVLLNGCNETSVEKDYPNLKDLSVVLDTLPTILNEVKTSRLDGAFAAFAVEYKNDVINIQYSFEDDHVGLDWVLLGKLNIKEELRVRKYLNSKDVKFQKKFRNGVAYLRISEGNLAEICRDILERLYLVKADDFIEVYYQGIDLEKYV